jgi:hypothetical protein
VIKLLIASSTVALVVCAACSGDNTTPNPTGNAGTATGGMPAGGTNTAQAGTLTTAGTMQGGASGSGAAVGGGGSGGAGTGGSSVIGNGGTSSAGASGAAGSAGAGGGVGVGGGAPAGCTADPHPLCLDFESAIDKATWTGGSDAGVSTMDKAHGTHSYHAYPNAGVLTTTKFGTITNDIWGRFYLRMTPGPAPVPAGTPGAPGGHGNIVGAYEGGAWYELGWQFNGLMGNWHNGGENPLRGHPDIMDQWYCVELHFDGTKTNMPTWYVDGQEAQYYMGEPNNPTKPHVITKFDKLTIGFTSYAGLGIAKDPYGNNNPPVMTDMWLDDIAFDAKRIGCIAP